jgi:hypothetical protein
MPPTLDHISEALGILLVQYKAKLAAEQAAEEDPETERNEP